MERKFELLDRVTTTKYDDAPDHEGYDIEGVIAEYRTYYDKESDSICDIDDDVVIIDENDESEHLYLVLYHNEDDKMQFEEFYESELNNI